MSGKDDLCFLNIVDFLLNLPLRAGWFEKPNYELSASLRNDMPILRGF